MRFFTTLLLLLSFAFAFASQNVATELNVKKEKKQKTEKVKKGKKDKKAEKVVSVKDNRQTCTLFLYGLSTSFNDSTAYITDVQVVDDAYLVNGKFLGGAADYCEQMNSYYSNKGAERRTNTVFFQKTREKAEKAYVKLRKRLNKRGIHPDPLPTGEFVFNAVKVGDE